MGPLPLLLHQARITDIPPSHSLHSIKNALTHVSFPPAARGGKAKRGEEKTKFSTSSPLDDHTARLWRALICTDFYVHSLSSDKERTKKTTRVSNSVLMGKLNCPLPKNFASKILPIERKISFKA